MIIDTNKILNDLKACPVASHSFGLGAGVSKMTIAELRNGRKHFNTLKIETAIKIKKYLEELKIHNLSTKTLEYMEKYNLVFDLEELVKKAMEDSEFELDLIDIWLNCNGDIYFEERGIAPAEESEDKMIKIGHIDDNELWLD